MPSDSFDRTLHHRSVLTNDVPLFTLAERQRLQELQIATVSSKRVIVPDSPNGLLSTFGARDIEFGFYGIGSDNGTFTATLLGLPTILPRLAVGPPSVAPRPIRLAELAVTLGTSTETNLNPITGEAATGTWRAADTIVATVEGTGIKLWDAGAVNGIARAIIDPLQCPKLFMYISNLTNVTRVEVAARRLTGFHQG